VLARDIVDTFEKKYLKKDDTESKVVSASIEEESLTSLVEEFNAELKAVEIEFTLTSENLEQIIPKELLNKKTTYNKKNLKNPNSFSLMSQQQLEEKV